MLYNLEGIPFEAAADANGSTYAQFRDRVSPRYGKVWLDIAKGYFFLGAVAGAFLYLEHSFRDWWWLYVIPAGLLIGYIAAYLALFIHEAGHFNIHPDKKMNDRLATWLLCLPFGLSIRSYRKIHWQHHVHLGTPRDTEISYFHALTPLFILETLTGIHLIRTLLTKNKVTVLTDEQVQESKKMLFAGFFFHALLISIFILSGYWHLVISWCAGFGVFFPFFATLRQLLEHRDELAHRTADFTRQEHGRISRLFVHGLLSSSFGAAGFTRHMIHHWDPQLSYTQLGAAEQFLSGCASTRDIITRSRTTYFKTAKKLLAHS